MRTHKQLRKYQSILQVLQDSGCPFCRFLKEYQADLLQNHPKESIHSLCNFHTWGLAAVQDAAAAAQVFIKLVDGPASRSTEGSECDICSEILVEENLRVRELVSCLPGMEISRWLHGPAVLCSQHGKKLRMQMPPALVDRIDAIIETYRQQLAKELEHLRNEPEQDRAGWGTLGRAPEFLVSQRGLHS